MREIKFRAWDSHIKRMIGWYDPIFLRIDENGRNTNHTMLCEYSMRRVNSNSNFLKYMQYTGLKDVDGVEIYEGDIVYLDSYGRYLVEWGAVGFTTSLLEPCLELSQAMNDFDDDTASSYEIIGNIYENPELNERNQL